MANVKVFDILHMVVIGEWYYLDNAYHYVDFQEISVLNWDDDNKNTSHIMYEGFCVIYSIVYGMKAEPWLVWKGLMGNTTYYVVILTGVNLLSALFNICTHITLGRG